MKRVAVIDYGLANVRSVVNALSCFEVDVRLVESGSDLTEADSIVLPGVGSFTAGMRGLRERGHVDALEENVRERGAPFLGICLGMQFLLEGSEEGDEPGLGWVPGSCRRFDANRAKVPHMGWNEVTVVDESALFVGFGNSADFYFVHGYFVPCGEAAGDVATGLCTHGEEFVASLACENIHGVQFHPEKSQSAGIKLINNFLKL